MYQRVGTLQIAVLYAEIDLTFCLIKHIIVSMRIVFGKTAYQRLVFLELDLQVLNFFAVLLYSDGFFFSLFLQRGKAELVVVFGNLVRIILYSDFFSLKLGCRNHYNG